MAVNTNFDFNELLRSQGGTPNAGYALTPEEQLQNQLIVRNQNQSNLLENYRDLPTEPEQKNGFGNKLLRNLPAILSALHYVAQSTSKSTESQRNAYGTLQNNMELFRQRKEQRRQRGIESLEAKRKKLAQQIQAEGGISELLQSQYNAKQKAKQEAFDQSLALANNERLGRATESDIKRNDTLNKATESTQKREADSYNADKENKRLAQQYYDEYQKTGKIDSYKKGVIRKVSPDFMTTDEQAQNFSMEIDKQVDDIISLMAKSEDFDPSAENIMQQKAQIRKSLLIQRFIDDPELRNSKAAFDMAEQLKLIPINQMTQQEAEFIQAIDPSWVPQQPEAVPNPADTILAPEQQQQQGGIRWGEFLNPLSNLQDILDLDNIAKAKIRERRRRQ